MSREAFHRWVDEQPRGRFERIDGQVVAMAPERVSDLRVKGGVYVVLRRAVAAAGLPCEAFTDGSG